MNHELQNSPTASFRWQKKTLWIVLISVNIIGVGVCLFLLNSSSNRVFPLIVGAIFLALNILLLVRFSSARMQKASLLESELRFPANPLFDALWDEKKAYLTVLGMNFRIVEKEEWVYTAGAMSYRAFVVEGAFAYTESRGDISEEAFERIVETADSIKSCMGWHEQRTINNTLHTGKVDKYASRRTRQILAEKWERGERETVFLIAGDVLRISFAITQKALPHAYSTWRIFGSFDDAFRAILQTYFMKQPSASSVLQNATAYAATRGAELVGRKDIHQERLDQMYTILARIESSDVDDIPMPSIPNNDLYADIFKALEMVLEDKRTQLQKAREQTEELARQAAEIQLANNKLEEQNRELEEQSIAIQLANTKLSEQNVELNTLNTEKNEIMGIVSHDLKNPIGAVRLFADMILQGYVQAQNIPDIATKIITTTERMLELVTNLLDLNRMEQGSMQYKMISASLYSILDSLMFEYHANAEKKNITLHLEKIGEEFHVAVDEQAITQVLDNLVSNALKYSPFETNIIIRLRAMESAMRVEVQDEGPGISEEDMKKLFGKFARLSAQPTGGEHSSGLGLSIVKKMVEAMNGKVWCESELGKGATFIVELPTA